jgi:iron complex transport system ATP-binding protein
VFGLTVKIVPDPVAGTPMVVPIGRHTTRTDRAEAPAASSAAQALAASAAANGVCRPTKR